MSDKRLGQWLPTADLNELRDYVRSHLESLYHPTSTARMAPLSDGGVVDTRLRVHGVQGLRVVDASVFPTITSGHTVSRPDCTPVASSYPHGSCSELASIVYAAVLSCYHDLANGPRRRPWPPSRDLLLALYRSRFVRKSPMADGLRKLSGCSNDRCSRESCRYDSGRFGSAQQRRIVFPLVGYCTVPLVITVYVWNLWELLPSATYIGAADGIVINIRYPINIKTLRVVPRGK
jgi:hypothetical protein